MWEGRSDTLAPLAALTSKTSKLKGTEIESNAFQKMKTIVAREVLLAYPNFLLPFKIHTDASLLQLGVVILQQGKPIAFYSRKVNPAQMRYTTTERKLLSIVETLKEFRNILLGYPLIVYTDHKNLTCKKFNTERVMRWCLLLEEFGPELFYIQGEHNIVAYSISRLDITENEPYEHLSYKDMCKLYVEDQEDFHTGYPLSYSETAHETSLDAAIQKARLTKPDRYKTEQRLLAGKSFTLVTREGKIVLPKSLTKPAVEWYHNNLCHPRETHTELTIGQHYCFLRMRNLVRQSVANVPAASSIKSISLNTRKSHQRIQI
jgi:RNase H-like domain found in reverse transcriptase